jgi:uncharacterized protein
MASLPESLPRPWYREPWPWILISGPAVVVVAGFVTLWLAVKTSDGLVAEDYYKQGLAVNRVFAREDAAERLGLTASVDPRRGALSVRLAGRAAPPALFVHLAHATRAGYDVTLRLARGADGTYRAELPPALPAGHWHVSVEDPKREWRLAGVWNGAQARFTLDPEHQRR